MKPTVVITIITVIVAVAAGVAIAGLPTSTPGADVVVLEVPTLATSDTPSVPTATIQPLETTTTTVATSEAPSTTEVTPPVTTTPATPVETQPSTTAAATTTTSTTVAPSTTEPPDTVDGPRPRDELSVATANASALSGVAGAHRDVLEAIGYVDVAPIDAEATAISAVYYQPGFELEAARLAADLGWDPLGLAPMDEVPELFTDRTFELIALIGLDKT